jgi:hypothetical protein
MILETLGYEEVDMVLRAFTGCFHLKSFLGVCLSHFTFTCSLKDQPRFFQATFLAWKGSRKHPFSSE